MHGRHRGWSHRKVYVLYEDQWKCLCKEVEYAPLGVEDAVLLEHFSNDGDGRVDGVGDDKDECLGRDRGDSSSKVTNDTSVDLQT